jgi:hypothetical protein
MLGTPALGQNAGPPTSNSAAPETVGPRELQNFSLNGTVTRQADTPPPPATAPRATPPPPTGRTTSQNARAEPTSPRAETRERPAPSAQTSQVAGASTATIALPPPTDVAKLPAGGVATPGFSDTVSTPPQLAPQPGVTLWPWLLVAAVVGGGAGLLFWRRRSREDLAGGPEIDVLAVPEPEARLPRVVPSPPPAPRPTTPKPVGLVSSKLRPWLELSFKPLRCVVEAERLTLDFEVELFNSGGSPARDILVEACMFGASPTQDQEIASFFAKSPGPETPVAMLAPLQRLNLRTSLVAQRSALAPADVGGQEMLVPVMAFNAVYRSGGGDARTSATFLLGRETNGDKLAPFKADSAPRAYAKLDARPLPMAVRR